MSQIATNDRQITLYCIEHTVMAKQTLAYAVDEGISVFVIDLSKTPITGSQIIEIATRLRMEVKDLINSNDELFVAQLDVPNLSTDDWIKMIHHNPEIIKHPIAIRGRKTIFVEKPTDIIYL